ncbi:MAG: HAD family hydrolase [Nanoarchaeota archaeon]|nr:HAD family hydrolase [Nanoarchaeota archaeon]
MTLKALIFDLDGTIINSFYRYFQWFKHCSEKIFNKNFQFLEPSDEYKIIHNEGFEKGGNAGIYEALGMDFKSNEELITKELNRWMKNREPIPVFEEVVQEIHNIYFFSLFKHHHFKFAINSGNHWQLYSGQLHKAGIMEYFDVKIGTSELSKKEIKPNPIGLAKTLELLEVKSEEAIYIGDTITDINLCSRLSELNMEPMKIISATWGFETINRLINNNPDKNYVVRTPEEMTSIVKNLVSQPSYS